MLEPVSKQQRVFGRRAGRVMRPQPVLVLSCDSARVDEERVVQGRARVLGWWPRLRGRADDKRRVQEAAQYGRPHGWRSSGRTTTADHLVIIGSLRITAPRQISEN